MDTGTISDKSRTASSLRLPNPRPDVYIQNIPLDYPRDTLQYIRPDLRNNKPVPQTFDCKSNLSPGVSEKNTFILMLKEHHCLYQKSHINENSNHGNHVCL